MIGQNLAVGLQLDPTCPIDWTHPLNYGMAAEWAVAPLPGWSRGLTLRNLVRGGYNPNDGVLTNSPTWAGSIGRLGGYGSLNFAGTAYVAPSNMILGSAFTVSIWLKWFAWQASGAVFNFGARPQLLLHRVGASNLEALTLDSAAFQAPACGPVDDGKWHHIVVTWLDNVAMTIYMDGALAQQDTTVNTQVSTSGAVTIGTDSVGNASHNWNGWLDGMQVWPSRCFTREEVAALYAETKAGNPNRWNWLGPLADIYSGVATPAAGKVVVPFFFAVA